MISIFTRLLWISLIHVTIISFMWHACFMFYVFVLCDYHQYHGVLVRWRCSCGDTFTCNCPILVLNKVYYYYYYSMTFTNYRASIKSAWKITTTTTYDVTMLHALLCKFHFKNFLWKTEKQSKYIAIEQTNLFFRSNTKKNLQV